MCAIEDNNMKSECYIIHMFRNENAGIRRPWRDQCKDKACRFGNKNVKRRPSLSYNWSQIAPRFKVGHILANINR